MKLSFSSSFSRSNLSLLIIIKSLLSVSLTSELPTGSFRESLKLRPLEDGKLHSRFTFDLSTSPSSSKNLTSSNIRPLVSKSSPNINLLQSDLIPISLLELVESFGIVQLSLSLSRGRWEFDRWTNPIDEEWQGYPRGAQLSVLLNQKSNSTTLINTLAGLFCASLNRLDLIENPPIEILSSTASISRKSSSSSEENFFKGQRRNRLKLFHGLLPIEQPCTENLTPLLRLLPCDRRSGLGSLVDPHKIFDCNWQSIRLKLNRKDLDRLEVRIEFESVFDPIREALIRSWSFKSIFGKSIESNCPLASSSKVEIIDSPNSQIEPRANEDGFPIDGKHSFDIMRAVLPLEIEMKWPQETAFIYPQVYDPSPIEVRRVLIGYGQTKGKLGIDVKFNKNKSNSQENDKDQEIIYFEQLPWWLSIYLHTMKIYINDVQIKDPKEIIIQKFIKPSIQRKRSYLLSHKLKISRSVKRLRIEIDYEKDLLLYHEYPSDANRGFDLNPGLIIVSDRTQDYQNENSLDGNLTESFFQEGGREELLKIQKDDRNESLTEVERDDEVKSFAVEQNRYKKLYWTNCGLISLATPDFSMPYNVIIVTSTAIALFFGSVFNLLVRDFKLVRFNKP